MARDEGQLAANGALRVLTGEYTGRSPGDKWLVDRPQLRDDVWWGAVNRPFPPDRFARLYRRVIAYLRDRRCFLFDGYVGAHPEWGLPVCFINEFAWQNLFVRQLFIRERTGPAPTQPPITVLAAPGFKASPEIDGTRSESFVILDLYHRCVLIGGTHYAGELKKAIFTMMNYLLPRDGVLSMHCSANAGADGRVALFFGLSGTGKTTLSADPERRLIGDDEHAWSDEGIFNLEGGCYAKCIRLSRSKEPQIWEAIRFGAVLENVEIHPVTRCVDYDSDRLTENTRAAYPIEYIPGALTTGMAGHPDVIIFLTADAFGLLPPVARLTPEQTALHFLAGYTSKLAGTERGVREPQATFSPCFGAPFLPLRPAVYARLLTQKIAAHGTRVFLVNTGWSGGPYGVGHRIELDHTRAIVRAVIGGQLDRATFAPDPVFGLDIPDQCPGVNPEILQPRRTWHDPAAYDHHASILARRFQQHVSELDGVSQEMETAG